MRQDEPPRGLPLTSAHAAGEVPGGVPTALRPHPDMVLEMSAADTPYAAAPMTLYVCTTCRDANHVIGQGTPCAGARLYAHILSAASDPLVDVVPVECLSVCTRTCAVGFAAPGKWTYVYGDMPSETAAETVLAGARMYAEAREGLIPWKLRPDALKKGVVARIPPRG